jgi:hypothetical protein
MIRKLVKGIHAGWRTPSPKQVQRKMAIVARPLRGEPLELVVRETNNSKSPG